MTNVLGTSPNSIHSTFRRECTYLAELTVHLPTLTVGETPNVAARARPQRGTNTSQQSKSCIRERHEDIVASLGLSQILKTRVGNDFVSGISGGERKRFGIAEILIGGTSLQCWDSSTRRLDNSNALQFVKTLRLNTNKHHTTAILTLYQSSQNIYEVLMQS